MLPIEIIEYIVFLSAIKCHICYKQYKISDKHFFLSNNNYKNKWYYCSKECYAFI